MSDNRGRHGRTAEEAPVAREFARAFYHSPAWKRTRGAYFRYRRGLCERCLSRGAVVPGEIVHHRVHLTPENIGDAETALGFANLELLCRDCHAARHPEAFRQPARQRVAFDEYGNTVRLEGE